MTDGKVTITDLSYVIQILKLVNQVLIMASSIAIMGMPNGQIGKFVMPKFDSQNIVKSIQ